MAENTLKTEVENRINYYLQKAVQSGLDAGLLANLVNPLKNEINAFWAIDFPAKIEANIIALVHFCIRIGIIFEDGSKNPVSTGEPPGFNNVLALFDQGDLILKSTAEEFVASIKLVTPEAAADGTIPAPYYESNLVNTWLGIYSISIATVPDNMDEIAAFASTQGLGNCLEKYFNPKAIIKVPSREEVAEDIYQKRHYRDLIDKMGIDIHIP